MNFRERMKVPHSRFEEEVFIELQHRGLANRLFPIDTTIILNDDLIIAEKEKVTYDLIRNKTFTIPDLLLRQDGLPIPVYLNGPPHKQRGVERRDIRIMEALKLSGFTPLVFEYGRPTKNRVIEVCNEIEKHLKS